MLTSKPWPEMGFQFRGEDREDRRDSERHPGRVPCRDASKTDPRCGLGRGEIPISMEVQRPNDGSDCNGSLPIYAETSLDRCEEHAMDVIDGFFVNRGGPMLEASNATRFHKPHG